MLRTACSTASTAAGSKCCGASHFGSRIAGLPGTGPLQRGQPLGRILKQPEKSGLPTCRFPMLRPPIRPPVPRQRPPPPRGQQSPRTAAGIDLRQPRSQRSHCSHASPCSASSAARSAILRGGAETRRSAFKATQRAKGGSPCKISAKVSIDRACESARNHSPRLTAAASDMGNHDRGDAATRGGSAITTYGRFRCPGGGTSAPPTSRPRTACA